MIAIYYLYAIFRNCISQFCHQSEKGVMLRVCVEHSLVDKLFAMLIDKNQAIANKFVRGKFYIFT